MGKGENCLPISSFFFSVLLANMPNSRLILHLVDQWAGRKYMGIHADVIVYIFSHLHMALRTESNMLEIN